MTATASLKLARRLVARLAHASIAVAINLAIVAAANAQHTEENAVVAAEDAFGVSVGNERIGLYSERSIRGFSPVTAGNVRIEGIYIDAPGSLNNRFVQGSAVRVGLTALGYAFPAPTGIVDYRMRGLDGGNSIGATIQVGPFGSWGLESDARIALGSGHVRLAAGASLRNVETLPERSNRSVNLSLAFPYRPSDRFLFAPFWSYSRNREDELPTVFVAGHYLPPEVKSRNFGQDWTEQIREQQTGGAILKAQLNRVIDVKAGIFRSTEITPQSFSDNYRNTSPAGLADHSIAASPEQRRNSTSGEVVVSLNGAENDRSHAIHFMARARFGDSLYGGSSSVQLEQARIGMVNPAARPNYVFGERSRNEVRQITGGIGYEGRWAGIGEINIGLQRTEYRKDVQRPGEIAQEIANRPWLYNVSLALFAGRRVAFYGGYTKGLEENGTAPEVAINRGEPLPAALTSQREAGVRFTLSDSMRLVAGVFDLRKPYYTLDARSLYTELGSLSAKGLEFSFTSSPAAGLNIVLGAALMKPRVTGEAVELGRVGEFPVGQSKSEARVNIDYRPPYLPALSFDAGIEHTGPKAASIRPDPVTGEQLKIGSRLEIDVGSRYRFNVGGSAAALRLQVQNLTNAKGWGATGSGGFRLENPRRFQAQLLADF